MRTYLYSLRRGRWGSGIMLAAGFAFISWAQLLILLGKSGVI